MIKDKDSHRWTMQKVQSERDRRLQGGGRENVVSDFAHLSKERREKKRLIVSCMYSWKDEKDLYRLTGQRG